MTVLKSQRRESKFEVFHNFYYMRKELTSLIFRHLGYKGNDEFFKWVINGESQTIMRNLAEAQRYITMANSIFPTNLVECDERRKLQDYAIGLNYAILQELQFVLETIPPIDKNKYVHFVDIINKEIKLLKGWRQSDNSIRKKIIG